MEYAFPPLQLLTWSALGTMALGPFILLGLIWGRKHPWAYILGCVVCIGTGAFTWSIRGPGSIELQQGRMVLKAALCSTQEIASADVSTAAWVDMGSGPWRPVKRTAGTGVGEIRTGWFRLADERKAYLVTFGDQALALETAEQVYLVAPEDLDDFKKQLQVFMPAVAAEAGS